MDNLIFLQNFSSIPEAELAKQLLESNGIKSMIQRGYFGAVSDTGFTMDVIYLYVQKKNADKAKKVLRISSKDKINQEHFIGIGTYRAEEADILKGEFEKSGIPVKVLYPGTNIGRESTAGAIWTAYTLTIRNTDVVKAKKICDKFNIKPVHKMPLPDILYGKNNGKYLLIIALFIFPITVIAGRLNLINSEEGSFSIIIAVLFLLLYYINLGYNVIKKIFR